MTPKKSTWRIIHDSCPLMCASLRISPQNWPTRIFSLFHSPGGFTQHNAHRATPSLCTPTGYTWLRGHLSNSWALAKSNSEDYWKTNSKDLWECDWCKAEISVCHLSHTHASSAQCISNQSCDINRSVSDINRSLITVPSI